MKTFKSMNTLIQLSELSDQDDSDVDGVKID